MYVGQDFSVCDPSENELYALDFVNDLASGEFLVASTWSCTVSQGTDPNPSARLSGSAHVFGTTITTQRVLGGIAGVSYVLQATVTTTSGNTLVLWSHSRVEVII